MTKKNYIDMAARLRGYKPNYDKMFDFDLTVQLVADFFAADSNGSFDREQFVHACHYSGSDRSPA